MSAVTAVKTSGETDIVKLLGTHADNLLNHVCKGIPKESVHLPGPDFVERVFTPTDRSLPVLRSLQQMFDHGRLGGTGYLSILPVDQGIEHSAGASFAKNPAYWDAVDRRDCHAHRSSSFNTAEAKCFDFSAVVIKVLVTSTRMPSRAIVGA